MIIADCMLIAMNNLLCRCDKQSLEIFCDRMSTHVLSSDILVTVAQIENATQKCIPCKNIYLTPC